MAGEDRYNYIRFGRRDMNQHTRDFELFVVVAQEFFQGRNAGVCTRSHFPEGGIRLAVEVLFFD